MAAFGRRLLISLLIGVFSSGAFAQQSAPFAKNDYSQEGVVIESYITKAVFANDGTGTRVSSVRVRVQSDAGVRTFGLLAFSYQSSSEGLDIDYVRVHKPDGSVVATPPENFQDMAAAITREAPFYSDLREKHVAVKGLGVGDILEYQGSWHVNKPLAPGQFWMDYYFNDQQIILDEQLEVRVPKQRAVKLKSPKVIPVIREDGNYRVYAWRTSNPKSKVESDEDKTELLVQKARGRLPQPDLRLSSFQGWDEIGRWYSDLQKDRVKPTPDIAAKAGELTKFATDENSKLHAIYHYVSTQYRYIGVDFGIGRYQPHTAAEVLSNQYGDCKDKHTLFAALLAAVGVNAYPALISITHDLDPDVPSPSQFDHVISVVPQGKNLLWLDTTPEVGPFGFLFSPLLGKQSLAMVEGKSAELTSTPAQLTTHGLTVFNIEAKLDDAGTLEGKVERENQGDDKEVLLRTAFRQVPLAQWKDLIQQISYNSGFAGDVSDVTASTPEDTDKPFHMSYSYKRKEYPDWTNHRVSPPLLPMVLPSAKDKDKKSAAPIWLGGYQEIRTHGVLQLPTGHKPQVPSAIHLVRDYAEYHATYEFKDGKFTADRRLIVKLDQVPASEEDDYKAFQKKVTDDRDNYVNVESADADSQTPSRTGPVAFGFLKNLPDSDNEEAMAEENESRFAAAKNPMGAIEPLERAVHTDPKFARAWALLGTLYYFSNRPEDSLNAYRKALAAAPKETALYKFVGQTLMQKKEYKEAAEILRQLIANVPDDKEAHENLGVTLALLKQYDEAAKELEMAVAQDPDRGYALVQLGSAYLRAGKKDKGMDAMHRALEIEPKEESANNVAYELAEINEALPDALKFAQTAVATEEELTRKTQLSDLTLEQVQEMGPLAAYWDTLGWIYYRMDNLDKAEKCLRAAWMLSATPTPADHLAQVYTKQHKINAAREMYRRAMGAATLTNLTDIQGIMERMAKLDPKPSTDKQPMVGFSTREKDLSALRTTTLPRFVTRAGERRIFYSFLARAKS